MALSIEELDKKLEMKEFTRSVLFILLLIGATFVWIVRKAVGS